MNRGGVPVLILSFDCTMNRLTLLIISLVGSLVLFGQETLVLQQLDSNLEYQVYWTELDDGKWVAHFADDTTQIAAEYTTRDGKKNGNYKAYFPSGQIAEWAIYNKGVKNGDWTLYSLTGEILVKGKYVEGVKHGYWAYRYCGCAGKYKKGELNGTWKCGEKPNMYTWTFDDGELKKGTGELPIDHDL